MQVPVEFARLDFEAKKLRAGELRERATEVESDTRSFRLPNKKVTFSDNEETKNDSDVLSPTFNHLSAPPLHSIRGDLSPATARSHVMDPSGLDSVNTGQKINDNLIITSNNQNIERDKLISDVTEQKNVMNMSRNKTEIKTVKRNFVEPDSGTSPNSLDVSDQFSSAVQKRSSIERQQDGQTALRNSEGRQQILEQDGNRRQTGVWMAGTLARTGSSSADDDTGTLAGSSSSSSSATSDSRCVSLRTEQKQRTATAVPSGPSLLKDGMNEFSDSKQLTLDGATSPYQSEAWKSAVPTEPSPCRTIRTSDRVSPLRQRLRSLNSPSLTSSDVRRESTTNNLFVSPNLMISRSERLEAQFYPSLSVTGHSDARQLVVVDRINGEDYLNITTYCDAFMRHRDKDKTKDKDKDKTKDKDKISLETDDLSVIVISHIGRVGVGKSTALNMILLGSNMQNSSSDLHAAEKTTCIFREGAKLGGTTEGVTGWLIYDPLSRGDKDGRKFAYLHLDFEGIGSVTKNNERDAKFLCLAYMISDMIVCSTAGFLCYETLKIFQSLSDKVPDLSEIQKDRNSSFSESSKDSNTIMSPPGWAQKMFSLLNQDLLDVQISDRNSIKSFFSSRTTSEPPPLTPGMLTSSPSRQSIGSLNRESPSGLKQKVKNKIDNEQKLNYSKKLKSLKNMKIKLEDDDDISRDTKCLSNLFHSDNWRPPKLLFVIRDASGVPVNVSGVEVGSTQYVHEALHMLSLGIPGVPKPSPQSHIDLVSESELKEIQDQGRLICSSSGSGFSSSAVSVESIRSVGSVNSSHVHMPNSGRLSIKDKNAMTKKCKKLAAWISKAFSSDMDAIFLPSLSPSSPPVWTFIESSLPGAHRSDERFDSLFEMSSSERTTTRGAYRLGTEGINVIHSAQVSAALHKLRNSILRTVPSLSPEESKSVRVHIHSKLRPEFLSPVLPSGSLEGNIISEIDDIRKSEGGHSLLMSALSWISVKPSDRFPELNLLSLTDIDSAVEFLLSKTAHDDQYLFDPTKVRTAASLTTLDSENENQSRKQTQSLSPCLQLLACSIRKSLPVTRDIFEGAVNQINKSRGCELMLRDFETSNGKGVISMPYFLRRVILERLAKLTFRLACQIVLWRKGFSICSTREVVEGSGKRIQEGLLPTGSTVLLGHFIRKKTEIFSLFDKEAETLKGSFIYHLYRIRLGAMLDPLIRDLMASNRVITELVCRNEVNNLILKTLKQIIEVDTKNNSGENSLSENEILKYANENNQSDSNDSLPDANFEDEWCKNEVSIVKNNKKLNTLEISSEGSPEHQLHSLLNSLTDESAVPFNSEIIRKMECIRSLFQEFNETNHPDFESLDGLIKTSAFNNGLKSLITAYFGVVKLREHKLVQSNIEIAEKRVKKGIKEAESLLKRERDNFSNSHLGWTRQRSELITELDRMKYEIIKMTHELESSKEERKKMQMQIESLNLEVEDKNRDINHQKRISHQPSGFLGRKIRNLCSGRAETQDWLSMK